MSNEFKIRWIVNAVRLVKRGKRRLNLGFCEKNSRVAFVAILGINNFVEDLKSFVIHEVYVDMECEDGEYCWNLKCPHNRATPEKLKKHVGKKCDSATLRKISEELQEIGEHFVSTIDWSKDVQIFFDKPPLILSYKKREKTK